MKVKEAAVYLTQGGYQCSAGTVRALVRSGKLGCYRGPSPRGPMQFPAAELDRFLRDELIVGGPKGEPRPARARKPKPEKVHAVAAEDDWEKQLAAERKA